MALKNVLLAEDDEDDILIFTLALQESHVPHNLVIVRDGEKLMAQLAEKIPDVLFLDVRMPCKSGRDCIKEIRANRRYDSMPVVILTSLDDPETRMFFNSERAEHFITKPSSIRDLMLKLSKLLDSTKPIANVS